MIHIGRAGSILGSFSEFEVRRGLASGRFFLTDLAWKQGMANWEPLSKFPEFATPMPPLPESEPLDETEPAEAALHTGLPWDDRKEIGWPMAFVATARLVFTSPSEAYTRMRVEGGVATPLLYNLIGGWIGIVASGVYAVFTSRMQAPPGDLSALQARFYLTPAMAMTALKMFMILGPVIATVNTLIISLITHLFLMLVGGANKPYHVTLRVFCFSYGSTQLLQFVPFCGSPLALVWMVAGCVVGLAIVHGTTTGRTMTAMLLFVGASFVCCMGFFFLAAAANLETLRPMLNK